MNYEKMIGRRTTRLREQKGMTTYDLAERVGISQAQISRLEKGKVGFRSWIIVKIARALRVQPAYFWIEDEAQARRVAGPSSK
jgi:transcriptional regulator with XRE-family HTH domain